MTDVKSKYKGTVEYALVYSELITAARYRGTVTYQEIAKLIGLPLTGNYMGSELGKILGDISEDEVSHGRPMLSVIVVDGKGFPHKGFYTWAKALGRQTDQTDEQFLADEEKAVYETWKVKLKDK